jgi:predicted nucleic acid-binding protein
MLTSRVLPSSRAIVLDTNVVLDWLLFRDPSSRSFAAAIAVQGLRWVASLAMREELASVLSRGLAQARNTEPAVVLAAWDAQVTLVEAAPVLPSAMGLQCSDPDDQKFLDLAHAQRASWLLSRDSAVLKLARRARHLNLAISVPEHWPGT